MQKRNITIISILTVFCVLAAAFVFLFMLNKPYIEFSQIQDETVEYGAEYAEPQVSALLKDKIFIKNGTDAPVTKSGEIDLTKLGSYTVTYNAKKLAWSGSVSHTVTVVDTKAPALELKGSEKVNVTKGQKYTEPGFTATDNYDGDIAASVAVSGEVDTSKTGEYTLTYSVSDSSGNKSELTRKVVVKAPATTSVAKPTESTNKGEKVVYLTFDDGPGAYTEKLLNVLNKYGVKATFFVTNNNPKYNYLMKDMAEAGHAVAIHTASHDYKKIYASEEAFFNDLYKMQDIIYEQTGVRTMLTRFPGGSSNTTSRFNPGIMTRLAAELTEKGFRYFDWNVTSGDAGETTSKDQVVKNVINGIKSQGTAVVLQHDIKSFSVNAVEEIIQWGLENGYTFKACDMSSPTCHHGINN